MESLTIGELAARSGVAPSALRYYERLGLIRAGRSGGNQRRYERSELRRVDERIRLLEGLRDNLTGCIGCGCLSLRTCALANPKDIAAQNGSGPRWLLGDE